MRLRQCEAIGEYAIAEDIREILRNEQEHLIDLATALGEDCAARSSSAGTLVRPRASRVLEAERLSSAIPRKDPAADP